MKPMKVRRVTKDMLESMARENARWPLALREWGPADWPSPGMLATFDGTAPTRVWRSRGFLVQQYERPGEPVRLTIQRTTLRADGAWMDEITWDELQRLKSEAGYGDRFAVEAYPADVDVVNIANLRHLWLVEQPAWVWSKR